MAPLDSRYTQLGFNLIHVQVCFNCPLLERVEFLSVEFPSEEIQKVGHIRSLSFRCHSNGASHLVTHGPGLKKFFSTLHC